MDRLAAPQWREAVAGLALLFAVFALADDSSPGVRQAAADLIAEQSGE